MKISAILSHTIYSSLKLTPVIALKPGLKAVEDIAQVRQRPKTNIEKIIKFASFQNPVVPLSPKRKLVVSRLTLILKN